MVSRYEQTGANPSFLLPVAPLGHANGLAYIKSPDAVIVAQAGRAC